MRRRSYTLVVPVKRLIVWLNDFEDTLITMYNALDIYRARTEYAARERLLRSTFPSTRVTRRKTLWRRRWSKNFSKRKRVTKFRKCLIENLVERSS